METRDYRTPAEWTDDCQGKKDFDGGLVELSSRYWPRGGSHIVRNPDGSMTDGSHPSRQEIRPSAISSVLLHFRGPDGETDVLRLAAESFEADTEAEVRAAVEEWAQAQMTKIVTVLVAAFPDSHKRVNERF